MIFAMAVLLVHLAWWPAADADTPAPPVTTSSSAAASQPDAASRPSDARADTNRRARAESDGAAKPAMEATSANPNSDASQVLATIRLPRVEPAKPYSVILPDAVPSRRKWIALSIVQHSAAAFDAYSTRQAVTSGAREQDPFLRPFAQSPAIYAVIQGGPVILDFAARKMQRSPNLLLRRTWWLPQSASTAVFLFSGAHNLSLRRR